MEIKNLIPFVLLLVLTGMLIGVGVLTLDKFSRAVRTTTTVIDRENNLSVTGTVDFSEEYCIAITDIDNGTTSFSPTTYNATFSSNADGCVMSYSAIAACALPTCNVTFTYGADSASETAATNTNSAITPIASTWLPLIVTVAILAIILTIVISSFAMGGRPGRD